MKKLSIMILVGTLLLFVISTAKAVTLNNPGFETGDLTGWIQVIPSGGSAKAVSNHTGNSTSYPPVEGDYFAELKTDGPGNEIIISQSLTLSAGDTLSGWAAFDTRDFFDSLFNNNDYAWVKIFDSVGTEITSLWYEDVQSHPGQWDGPWTYWEWTAPAANNYTLSYGVANGGDGFVDTYALFDSLQATPIPEPNALLLMTIGLLGLVGLKKNHK